MWRAKFHPVLLCLCFNILLLSPTSAFTLGRPKRLEDLLKMGIVGVILGGAHHHLSRQKEQENAGQPLVSAQHHHPMLLPMPWHQPQVPQHPFMHPQSIIPQFLHHQPHPGHMLQQLTPILPHMVPVFQQAAPWIPQWPKEQAFAGLMHQFPHPGIPNYANHPGRDLPGFSTLESIPALRPWHPPPIIRRMLELEE